MPPHPSMCLVDHLLTELACLLFVLRSLARRSRYMHVGGWEPTELDRPRGAGARARSGAVLRHASH
eukprot:2365-Prymnesium_polylepis.1